MEPHPESFRAVVDRVRKTKGQTAEEVGLAVSQMARSRELGRSGASYSSFTKHVAGSSPVSPSVELMTLTAEALGINAEEFAEYRLAMMRASLDENVVGLQPALDQLRRIEAPRRRKQPAEDSGLDQPRTQDSRQPGRAGAAGKSTSGR